MNTTDTPESVREEFERWAKGKSLSVDKEPDGWGDPMYKYPAIDAMWYAWQGASAKYAALLAAVNMPVDARRHPDPIRWNGRGLMPSHHRPKKTGVFSWARIPLDDGRITYRLCRRDMRGALHFESHTIQPGEQRCNIAAWLCDARRRLRDLVDDLDLKTLGVIG